MQPTALDRIREEALIHARPVEVGATDGVDGAVVVSPVDVLRVDRHAAEAVGAGDEVPLDPGSIQVGPADVVDALVPVDVPGIDGNGAGAVEARDPRDEVLIHPGPVEIRAPDGVRHLIAPVDVLAIDGNAAGPVRTGDEALVGLGSVHGRPADSGPGAAVPVRPIDVGVGLRGERQHQSCAQSRGQERPLHTDAGLGPHVSTLAPPRGTGETTTGRQYDARLWPNSGYGRHGASPT